jgi:aspartyl-tRNA(Asn)/glutamyl-tRNA(Gln) amidotransferase subunit B
VTPYEPVIGLEVHVQLGTASKAFSPSGTAFGAPPNSLTDPVVLGLPGALPVLNARAVEYAVTIGLASGCEIRRTSRFARKHYFYPDLPKGYQISQYDEPLCEHGRVDFWLDGKPHSVRLTRIHMEEDAGKNLHEGGAVSRVDLNRAGVPLCEIVSEPDLRSAEEAAEYMRAIRRLVRYLRISDGNMEQGSLRCDANVSLRPVGRTEFGTRVELKNINSFKFVQKAIEHEIARQTRVLTDGGTVVQETRLWDADAGVTRSMRGKEEADDYRYFPDPDLPPLAISDDMIARLRAALPELPAAVLARYTGEYGLSEDDARNLASERELAEYFDATAALAGDPKRVANIVVGDLRHELSRRDLAATANPIAPAALAELVGLVAGGAISGTMAKDVLGKMIDTGDGATAIVDREGLRQISDTGAIEAIARKIVDDNAKQADSYRAGKQKVLGFFVGQVMRETRGKANPAVVNEILVRILTEEAPDDA